MQRFTGIEYLKIDIAGSFGLDKKKWQPRIEWTDQNEAILESLVHKAEHPALFYAGLQAYRKAQRKEASGYPISLDGTSSGLQILAAITGDRRAAELCNVVPVGDLDDPDRCDAYTIIYDHMLLRVGEAGKISRDDCKDAIMTSLYGSTAVPKQVFGEGYLLQKFFDTMEEDAPFVWDCNQAFLDMWNPNALSHNWVMPDNFHVNIKVEANEKGVVHFLNQPFEVIKKVNAPTDQGRSIGANVTHSIDGMMVREITRRCDYDPAQWIKWTQILEKWTGVVVEECPQLADMLNHYQQSGYMSARIFDFINEATVDMLSSAELVEAKRVLGTFAQRPFKVISIHD